MKSFSLFFIILTATIRINYGQSLVSNLPLMVINTNNQTIPDEPKIICDMGIIYNGIGSVNQLTDPFNNYNGKIAIEIRGSSSQMFPKECYGFETVDTFGNKMDSSLIDMPREHDWILRASYSDKTFLRDVLAYKLFRDFGRYAPRTQFCELFVNGQYQGEIDRLKEWIRNRIVWMDVNMPGNCIGTGTKDKELPVLNNNISVYPNPFSTTTTIQIKSGVKMQDAQFVLYDILGKAVRSIPVSGYTFRVERKNLQTGIYFYKLNSDNKIITSGKLIIQ